MKYSFECLEVWQMLRELVKDVYQVIAIFPQDERFGLTSQIRRSSVSVSSNIAEGSTRWSKKDQSRFYEIAFGSLIEALNQLILATDLEFLQETQLTTLRGKIDHIGRMLNGLYQSAHQQINKPINQYLTIRNLYHCSYLFVSLVYCQILQNTISN